MRTNSFKIIIEALYKLRFDRPEGYTTIYSNNVKAIKVVVL
jgi:hypothetical protein